jgi:hypothetical protein
MLARGGVKIAVDGSKQVFDFLGRASEHGMLAPFDDGALEEVWVLDQEAYDLVVREFALSEFEFFVDSLACAQKFARRDAHLAYKLAQFGFANRLDVIVDLLEINAALTEQAVGLAALGSGRLLVNCDFVFHSFQFSVFSFQSPILQSRVFSRKNFYANTI